MSSARTRLVFVDCVRGFAVVGMLANHVAVSLLDGSLDPARHTLAYVTLTLSGPLFLFLVGFSMALSFGAAVEAQTPQCAWLRSCLVRGVMLIVLGWLMNLVVAPGEPAISGGILQTIGLAIVLLAPLLAGLRERLVRDLLMLAALLTYVSFVAGYPTVSRWLADLPTFSSVLFDGFPPWPWIAMVMLGLSLGATWVFGTPADVRRTLLHRMTIAGLVSVGVYLLLGYPEGEWMQAGVSRDYIINNHWLPGYSTVFWIVGASLLIFCGAYYVFETKGLRLRWLSALGAAALTAYVAHLVIIHVLARNIFNVTLDSWLAYIAADVAILLVLILLASLPLPRLRDVFRT